MWLGVLLFGAISCIILTFITKAYRNKDFKVVLYTTILYSAYMFNLEIVCIENKYFEYQYDKLIGQILGVPIEGLLMYFLVPLFIYLIRESLRKCLR